MVVSVRTQQPSRRARRLKGDDRENSVDVLDIHAWIENPEVKGLLRKLVKPRVRKAHEPLAPPAEDRQGLSYFAIIWAAQLGVELARSFSRRLAAIEEDAKDARAALAAIETLRRSVVAKADGQAFVEGANDGWGDRAEAALKEAETTMRFRLEVAEQAEALHGGTRKKGGAAALNFGAGAFASAIRAADPNGSPHDEIVAALAAPLFGGDGEPRKLRHYRETFEERTMACAKIGFFPRIL
jgi:hypothetical protein